MHLVRTASRCNNCCMTEKYPSFRDLVNQRRAADAAAAERDRLARLEAQAKKLASRQAKEQAERLRRQKAAAERTARPDYNGMLRRDGSVVVAAALQAGVSKDGWGRPWSNLRNGWWLLDIELTVTGGGYRDVDPDARPIKEPINAVLRGDILDTRGQISRLYANNPDYNNHDFETRRRQVRALTRVALVKPLREVSVTTEESYESWRQELVSFAVRNDLPIE